MAELAAVGAAANILQLIDFGSRVITRLEEFHAYVDEVPYTFISIKHRLPLLLDTLKKTQDAIDVGMIKRETDAALGAVIRDCMLQIQSLEAILLKILPTSQDSWLKRSKRAISSFNQDSAVQKISSKIRHHVQVLTYYHAAQTMPNPEKGTHLNSRKVQKLTEPDNELMEIRHWLAAPDPSINYKQALRVRRDDTGLWFLENEHYLE